MECGEDFLRAWWNPNDYLGLDGETKLTNDSVTESCCETGFKSIENR
ncbi:hypothetical protein [Peribacillus sp. FSL H8-0477]